jgi:hypothetical protein
VAYRIRWSPQELAAAEERLGKLPGLATETTWILPMQARYVIGRDGNRLCRYQCRLSATS